jgi:hypothetical protein
VAQSRGTRLLMTRRRTGIAIGLTAFVFVLAIRDVLHPGHTRGLLLPWDFWVHGRLLIGANIVFYAYLCWLAFWFVRGTHGRERVVMVGWFTGILLSPLEYFWPDWSIAIRYITTFGLAVALLAAIALLLQLHKLSSIH